jgi:hypothetical protein
MLVIIQAKVFHIVAEMQLLVAVFKLTEESWNTVIGLLSPK